MQPEIEPALRNVIGYLETHKIRYAIIGGVALSHWGVIRVTRDVDIKVYVPNLEYAEMRKILQEAFPKQARDKAPKNPLIFSIELNGIIVDFLLAIPGYESQIFERSVRSDLGGWEACICSAEDLIIQKIVAGREKDWLDIEMLLIEQNANLDYAYVENWLNQFAEALENPELLQRYHDKVEKIRKLRADINSIP